MNDALRLKLASYGTWTYRSAWALEIVAAILGLATGIVLGYQSFTASETATASDLVLASAPFVMVALAELSKIPIATLLFSVRWIWKPFLAILLLLMAGITFETVFFGLERATTLRQLKYQDLKKAQEETQRDINSLRADKESTRDSTAVKDAQENIEKTSLLAEEERKSINKQIADLDKEMEGQLNLGPRAVSLRETLAEKESARADILLQQQAEIQQAVSQFEGQRDSYTERLKSPNATPDQIQRWTDELSNLKNPVPPLKTKFDAKNLELNSEIDSLRREFEKLRGEATRTSTVQKDELERRRADLLQRLDESASKWGIELDKQRQRLANAQDAKASAIDRLKQIDDELREQLKKYDTLENERVKSAREDQIQRIASRVYGKDPEDIGPEQSNIVAIIWFGSLAGLAALAGPISAVTALGLQRIGLQTGTVRPSPLSRSIRKLLVNWRWRRKHTVHVDKEVPVEKVVEKRVEVPVEKIIKEILYVPILTDDPDLVREALAKDLPPEVASMVKATNRKRKSNGNPA